MIKFRCSNCNKKFGVPDDYAGRRIRCNTCGQHTFVPKESNIDTPATEKTGDSYRFSPNQMATAPTPSSAPMSQPASSDDQIITMKDLANTQNSTPTGCTENKPMVFQMQSFHDYSLPVSEAEDPAPAKPDAKNSVSELPKRSRPDLRTDRVELTLDILSYISCIGPVLFIAMFVYFITALASGHSIHAMPFHNPHSADPNVASTSEPNAVPAADSTPIPLALTILKYAFYAFGFVISPLSLIGSLFLVFRHSYDMPKTLYFAIILHGLIFLNIFRG